MWQALCVRLHVFGSACAHRSAFSVCGDNCTGTCPHVSAHDFHWQVHHKLLSTKPVVCALPWIVPDVTSLRTVYMSDTQRWPNSIYWPCECVCKLPAHSTQTCCQLCWWHPLCEWLVRGGRGEKFECPAASCLPESHADRCVSAPGLRKHTHSDFTDLNGVCVDCIKHVAREHKMYFSISGCVGKSYHH